jgi:hypothetical protein
MDLTSSVILPGSIIYRATNDIFDYNSNNIINSRRKCPDTGKTGIYFSNYVLQALAMSMEYETDLDLGIFRVLSPIFVINGKYSFRNIHSERYFRWNNGESTLITNVEPLEDENINHFDAEMVPIIKYSWQNISYAIKPQNIALSSHLGEIFIADQWDLKKIKLEKKYQINYKKLTDIIHNLYVEYQLIQSFDFAYLDALTPLI